MKINLTVVLVVMALCAFASHRLVAPPEGVAFGEIAAGVTMGSDPMVTKRKTGCSVKLYDRPVMALPLLDPLVGLVYWLRRNVRPIIIAPVILL